jgi:hypothetical protein
MNSGEYYCTDDRDGDNSTGQGAPGSDRAMERERKSDTSQESSEPRNETWATPKHRRG